MKFTRTELAEIRSAFRQRIATASPPKRARARTPKSAPQPRQQTFALVRWPDYDDDVILTLGEIAELFAVSPRTIRRWADAGRLPSFRTLGGWRRFRWGDIRVAI
jgi:excisionase family DNA binding protein